MGKGDQKSKRGKINAGSYGKRRPRKSSKPAVVAEQAVKAAKEEKPKVAAKPKAEKAVSYTHLDVYKRQTGFRVRH